MAAHRRPLVTSAVAGGLLCALWFVPSANATDEAETEVTPPPTSVSADQNGTGPQLADTGSFDTTPYITGGIAFLAAGAGLVTHSLRRTSPS
ncbi:LAETG motif-containing sortase-dependent surface protein [Streptomyces gobiensis]|uniref:LAETG motif-containing sortase-dependent surface protein n=1 Tax=Streptomyces gobiensis TaxID=2875706 RepID=UPI001E4B3D35|nr:LAETG motif-containing sortase-dependent surface protein [Streptomyces gobiensis]UGY93332.1 hypothetical protein test1122_17505 [Streptomyces gobiensis]